MRFKEFELKVRINKNNKSFNFNLPKRKLSVKELDNIQKKGSVKFLMENLE